MRFTKMHGIGNDFIMVNCMGDFGDDLAAEARKKAVSLCDRNFGIGADGVILVQVGSKTRFCMTMYNPDGSEAEMCGNGIRCYAKLVYDHGFAFGETEIPVETGAGVLRLHLNVGSNGKVETVRVDMGEPVLDPARIPTTLGGGHEFLDAAGTHEDEATAATKSEGKRTAALSHSGAEAIDEPLALADRTLRVTAVSMGNPHAVTFVDDVAAYPVHEVGPQVEHNAAFPRRTNTEFIQVLSDREIAFRVWERGAGETLACGTGACAAVVAAVLNGKTGRNVLVHLPGGDLEIEWSDQNNHVYMTGAAVEVFDGETP